jgi:glycosyltransferase involved in cell wall biosynthesis
MRRSIFRTVTAVVEAVATQKPAIILRDRTEEMHLCIRQVLAGDTFDVIHADQTSMAQYALYAQAQLRKFKDRPPAKIMLDAHNALHRILGQLADEESKTLKRLALRRESQAMTSYEKEICTCFDHVVFVNDADRETLNHAHANGTDYTTIPICIDLQDRKILDVQADAQVITHLGTMFWPPNVAGVYWFATEVFPRILMEVPNTKFVIIGKRPPPLIQELPQQYPNIHVTGYVKDPIPHLEETAAFIVPLHAGAGMRVKILDAWCWGVPIVTTSHGMEGIVAEPDETLLVADTPDAFAQAVIDLLRRPELRLRLREQGRTWVDAHYNWQRVYKGWQRIYQGLMS